MLKCAKLLWLSCLFIAHPAFVGAEVQKNESFSKTPQNEVFLESDSGDDEFLYDTSEMTEETDLVIRGVRLIDHPEWGAVDFGPALKKYPDLLNCFGENYKEGGRIDISNFPWMAFIDEEELVVCVSAVSQFLRGPKKMTKWLLSQNMSIDEIKLNVPDAGLKLMGTKKKTISKRNSSILRYFSLFFQQDAPAISHFAGVMITYTAEGEIFNVQLNPGSK